MFGECISGQDMKIIDKNCGYLGISPLQLMESAGACIAQCIRKTASDISHPLVNVVFFAGKGNNGGDAFVAARHLSSMSNMCCTHPALSSFDPIKSLPAEKHFNICVICLYSENDIKKEEAKTNLKILLRNRDVNVVHMDYDDAGLSKIRSISKEAHIIVDCVLGTGFSGFLRFKEDVAVSIINEAVLKYNTHVLAVDVPSGLGDFNGYVDLNDSNGLETLSKEVRIVRASKTITFHKMKTYLSSPHIKAYTGDVLVCPIGIPRSAELFVGPGLFLNLHRRCFSDHKGNGGKVLIVGGGPYTGAPVLSALSALRAGADIVSVATPAPVFTQISSYSPDIIVKKLPSGSDCLCGEDVSYLKNIMNSYDSVVLGPGLGNDPETLRSVLSILSLPECKNAVIDADAIQPEIKEIEFSGKNFILTPHKGELKRLCHTVPEFPDLRNQSETSEFLSNMHKVSRFFGNSVFLIKGATDIICGPEKSVLNNTGNPEMCVGGTGDVLSGIVGAFLSKNESFQAAACGAFLSGLSGDMALKSAGPGLTASDVSECISKAHQKIQSYLMS